MVVYKRGAFYWSDFTINGQRHRIPLKTTKKQEAVNCEKAKIAEAQSQCGLLPTKTSRIGFTAAGELYLARRESQVSASTMSLERYGFKQLSKHFATIPIGAVTIEHLDDYVRQRKAAGVGNRSINIEVGVLRRLLKQFRQWGRIGDEYKPLSEPKDIGRALTPEQELSLFNAASSRPEWAVAFHAALVTTNTTASGCELRNLKLQDIDLAAKMLYVRVGKNRFRVRVIPLNRTAAWAMERLLNRAHELGATKPDHYLIPSRVAGKTYDPTKPPSQWAWRTSWRKLTEAAGLQKLRLHDLRHHAITRLAESSEVSEQAIMAIAGHVSREMLQHYSHIRQEAKRKAVAALDNVTITSHLAQWQAEAEERDKKKPKNINKLLVGAEGFEPPTLCSQSRCATRLRYAPTFSFDCIANGISVGLSADIQRLMSHATNHTTRITGNANTSARPIISTSRKLQSRQLCFRGSPRWRCSRR